MPTTSHKTTTTTVTVETVDTSAVPAFPDGLKLPALIVTIALSVFALLVFLFTILFGVDLSRIFF